jgi:glycosyltransferase involved in cell wall biosynthesis
VGALDAFYTDIWAPGWLEKIGSGVKWREVRSLIGRRQAELGTGKVISWSGAAIVRSIEKRVHGSRKSYLQYIQDGHWFSEKVRNHLASKNEPINGKYVFSYDTTALELFQWAREKGAICVLGQMDPAVFEQEIVRNENAAWPEWQAGDQDIPHTYNARREREWELADVIIVNSRWSLDALLKQGVPAEKLRIVPLCFEESCNVQGIRPNNLERITNKQPLRVLFLGQVILRKGIQYLMEAAKHPDLREVQFDVVGPIGISAIARNTAPPSVHFHGPVSRSDTERWFLASDLFLLATLSDGFALTQLEALSHGLPVIATPNCGEVVRDEVDGLIVPARDVGALVSAIKRFDQDRQFLAQCSQNGLERVKDFSLDKMREKLIADVVTVKVNS